MDEKRNRKLINWLGLTGIVALLSYAAAVVFLPLVVLLSIISLILLIIAGFGKGGLRGTGILAAVALFMMMVGAIGQGAVPPQYFGIVEHFSVFAAVGFNAVLGVYLFKGFREMSRLNQGGIGILLIILFLIVCVVGACGKENIAACESIVTDTEKEISTKEPKSTEKKEATEQWEKGYDLPVDEHERKEAETDCKKLMEIYFDIYESADKGTASNVVLSDETALEMQRKLADLGCPVITMVPYANMENFKRVDSFLEECMEGKSGSVVIYRIHSDGGLGRMRFIFDGKDMYVVSARGIWNADNKPGISYISNTRLKEWKYTDKGWFCYELCVPEPPEVNEI